MSLEMKKKKLELARVQVARQELEYKIEERKEEIERLEAAIEIQKKREFELSKEIES